jgi:pimeloyl-ACP methyl ester carboxylesterase
MASAKEGKMIGCRGMGRLIQFGMRLWLGLVLIGMLGIAPAAAESLKNIIQRIGGQPCRSGELTCVNFKVPIDHFNPGKRMSVEFAVHFAAEKSKGILVYVVGGPGISGTAVADSYLSAYDKRLTNEMDIIFFDQRGVGPISGLNCAKAQSVYDEAPLSPDQPEASLKAAKDFVAACMATIEHADLLPYLGTEQAIRDLDAFRRKLGSPKVWLYGESYGTQFVQQYAARYPGALNGVIIDGVVDLNLDADGYYTENLRTITKVLQRAFDSCDGVPQCRADMAQPPAAVYDDLLKRLAAGPLEIDFPLADGTIAKRQLSDGMLNATGFYALFGRESRSQLLRALAAASHDNFVPMLRLGYSNLGLDPQTLEIVPDTSWYGAAYFGITCPDYDDAGSNDPEARARAILARAKTLQGDNPRLIRSYFAERLACVFWPGQGRQDRPKTFTGGTFPTLVMNGTGDPATPISNGYAVFDRLKNGRMITMEGGPHVIWGQGIACPDKLVFGLMLDGRQPEMPEQLCRQSLLADYSGLTLTAKDAAADPLVLARAIETELVQSVEISNWDGETELAVGCDFGGAITVTATETATEYAFKECAWWQGMKVSGSGSMIEAGDGTTADGLTLDLDISGTHYGKLAYRHDTTTDAMSLAGTYDGKPLTPPRPGL